jgi:plasmid stabilization system protein ParE
MPLARSPRRCAALTALAALAAAGASASAAESSSIEDQLEQVLAEQRRLASENMELRREMEELRAQTGDNWLTERRGEEIRAMVADVLADADTRSSLLQDGMMAGWNEHFFLADAAGQFKLQIEGQLQIRWIYSFRDAPDRHRHGFEVTRAALALSGHVFNPNLTYYLRTDQTRNEPGLVTGLYYMQDAWMAYRLNNEWRVRAGQFKLPFNREELVASSKQLAVERSLVNESLNLGRSIGVELSYMGEFNKLSFAASNGGSDTIGGFGTVVGTYPPYQNWDTEDVEFAITGRWESLIAGRWGQFADMTSPPGEEFGMLFGLAGHFQIGEYNGAPSLQRNETRWTAVTADLSLEWGGANLMFAGFYHFVDSGGFGHIGIPGFVVQGGVYLTPKLEFYSRWEYGWWDFDNQDFHDLNALTLGANYYLDGHDVKWTTDIGFGIGPIDQTWDSSLAGWRQDPRGQGAEPQIVFRTQFQLLF